MKYLFFSFFALLFVLSGCAGTFAAKNAAAEGLVLEGSAQGYRGLITVQVQMDGSQIADIIIIDSDEDRFVGEAAMEELIDMVIMYNTADIDAVSGATESSRGFLEAVQNAILGR
ncbi:MAG: FMN-binding protein [Treponema sp.]|nr:FMN-binding protein [Treponema sp.]